MDKKMLMEMMMKKKDKKSPMSDLEMKAKKSVLGELKALAQDAMGEKVKGLKKVTVASDSPEGLEKGLEMAKDKVEEMAEKPEMEEEDEEMEESEETDMTAMMDKHLESCSEEELKKVIAKAQEVLASKKMPV